MLVSDSLHFPTAVDSLKFSIGLVIKKSRLALVHNVYNTLLIIGKSPNFTLISQLVEAWNLRCKEILVNN